MRFRSTPAPQDVHAIRHMAAGTGFFRPDEIDVAAELIEEYLAKGAESGYHFHFADEPTRYDTQEPVYTPPLGYVCYGPTPCTIGSFDLYWIVVDKASQGNGLGLQLMQQAEQSARSMEGRRMYVETSGKELYRPTQTFYEKAGYRIVARLPDFYDLGDDKIIYQKDL